MNYIQNELALMERRQKALQALSEGLNLILPILADFPEMKEVLSKHLGGMSLEVETGNKKRRRDDKKAWKDSLLSLLRESGDDGIPTRQLVSEMESRYPSLGDQKDHVLRSLWSGRAMRLPEVEVFPKFMPGSSARTTLYYRLKKDS